jgi:hypothetical protein
MSLVARAHSRGEERPARARGPLCCPVPPSGRICCCSAAEFERLLACGEDPRRESPPLSARWWRGGAARAAQRGGPADRRLAIIAENDTRRTALPPDFPEVAAARPHRP